MNPEEFAARRRKEFEKVDAELLPSTERALQKYARGDATWADELIDDASVLWLEHFQAEAPNADPDRYMPRFRDSITESLGKTAEPSDPPDPSQVERVARWLGTYTVNDATWSGSGARGTRAKRWTTMHDADVREKHAVVDGQVRPIGAPFHVGGYELRFPGDPVGPPEIWINCRCIIQPAAPRGEANVSPTTFAMDEEVEPEVVDEDLPTDDLEEDEEEVTEVPVHGVLAPEGVPTGDGRQFGEGALTNRDLPLPIAYQLMSADGHSGSVTVGRIDEVFRQGNEMRFRGAVVLTKEHSPAVIEGIIDGTVRGVSVDVDDVEVDMSVSEDSETSMGLTVFSHARIAGVTIVPIPAFQEAYISLGHEFADELDEEALAACAECAEKGPEDDNPDIELGYDDYSIIDLSVMTDEEVEQYHALAPDEQIAWLKEYKPEAILAAGFAPGTKDGPGWITHPIPTSRIRRYWTHGKGAAKIRWGTPGDFNRCRRQLAKYIANPQWLAGACANMHKEAIGLWPGGEAGRRGRHSLAASGTPAPIFNLVASVNYVFDSRMFAHPKMESPRVGVEVEGDHVFGYIAQWGVCHVGISGVCTEAPSSKTDYWYYATGKVDTDEGVVRVGQITMDTGHAPLRSNAKVAAAHYDNTGAAAADVAVGEDEFGIWFSGVLRSKVTDEQRHALRASGRVSGDWRTIGGDLELVAALAVNVPGFPIPHARAGVYNGEQVSLVAAGLEVVETSETPIFQFTADEVAGLARAAIREYRHQEKRAEQAKPIRDTLRQKKIATLRSKIKE